MERTWEISDIDGTNKRTVTLAQYRAEIETAKQRVRPVVDAFRRGDRDGMAKAQSKLADNKRVRKLAFAESKKA